MDLLNGLLSAAGAGALIVMLGSHAALFDVAAIFQNLAKGNGLVFSFNFGTSTTELVTRGIGLALMLYGFWVIAAQKFI